jgi:hypothetical protein
MVSKQNPETRLQNEILCALSEAGYLCWRQHVGLFRAMHSDHIIKIGMPGMADIGAIMPVTVTPEMVGKTVGLAVQIEVKTATGSQAAAQKTWQQAVEYMGGIYRICRSPDDALGIIP